MSYDKIFKFDRTLEGLLEGDARLGLPGTRNTAICGKLRQIHKIWAKYKPILNNNEFSQEDLVKAVRLNMLLLREMDNAVKMYVRFLK